MINFFLIRLNLNYLKKVKTFAVEKNQNFRSLEYILIAKSKLIRAY
jgi:hypothetical protein